MGEFLDFLLISVLVYYVIRGLIRFFVPVLFEKAVNKAQQQYQHQQQYRATDNRQQNYNSTGSSQGSIKVDYVPPQSKKKKGSIPDSEGDFVDYEEVK